MKKMSGYAGNNILFLVLYSDLLHDEQLTIVYKPIFGHYPQT